MSSHHIYNLCVNAKWVRELCDMVMETENKKIRIRDIIKFCAPRIERREERFFQLKKLSEARPVWNFKEPPEVATPGARPEVTRNKVPTPDKGQVKVEARTQVRASASNNSRQ